jgi:hypothetical protein
MDTILKLNGVASESGEFVDIVIMNHREYQLKKLKGLKYTIKK